MIHEVHNPIVIHWIVIEASLLVPMHNARSGPIMEVMDPGDNYISFSFPLFSFLLFRVSAGGWWGARTPQSPSTLTDGPLRRLFHTMSGTPACSNSGFRNQKPHGR